MSKFIINKNGGYTVLNNSIFKDKNLSLKAKGILCLMMSLPEDWNYTLKGLASLSKDNIDSLRQGINELKTAGYIVQHQVKNEKGKWAESVYDVYEEPQVSCSKEETVQEKPLKNENIRQYPTENRSHIRENNLTDLRTSENPITANRSTLKDNDLTDLRSLENPITEKPITENPTQLNKELNNKYINISYPSINNINNNIPLAPREKPMDEIDKTIKTRQAYKELIHENIEYEYFRNTMNLLELKDIDGLVEIMLDVVCSKACTMRVGGEEKPTDIVKSRFLKLTSEHVQYVLECMRGNATKVRNIRAYMITSLYNAPATINAYYAAEVAHDTNSPMPPDHQENDIYRQNKHNNNRKRGTFFNFKQRDNDLDALEVKLNRLTMEEIKGATSST